MCSITQCFYTIYQIGVYIYIYIRMIQVNEGISLKIISGFEHYAITFRNFILDICDMLNPCYFIIYNNSKVFKLSVAVNCILFLQCNFFWQVHFACVLSV